MALLDLSTVNESGLIGTLSLSEAEQNRLAGLNHTTRRRDWLAGRFMARSLLEELSDHAFEITADDSKPLVKSNTSLFCNWSHSHGWLLAAATRLGPIGCDIERCKSRPRLAAIISKNFATAEANVLLNMSNDEQLLAFFQLWTLKESALKADGVGIGRGMKTPEFYWQNEWQPLDKQLEFHTGGLVTEPAAFQWAVAWEPQQLPTD